METRLENLTLDVGNKKVKKGSNLTQLLIQGLHSKDNRYVNKYITLCLRL